MKVTWTIFERGKRVAAWCCIGTVGIISLLPGAEVAPLRTGLGGHAEHLLTYAATSMITARAYLDFSRFKIAASLVFYAAALEFLQRYAPGRSPSFEDLAFSVAGIVLGLTAFHLLQHVNIRQGTSKQTGYG